MTISMADINELLTVVVPVKNEALNLQYCLEKLSELSNVIVVDSQSSDDTCRIAEKHHRKVVQFRWSGKYPKKRNWVLHNVKFTTPWVMFLDADELINENVLNELHLVLPNTKHSAFYLCFDNWFCGKMLRHGDTMCKMALIRVGFGEYERTEEEEWSSLDMEIHEQMIVEGTVGKIKARLEHYDKRSLESHLKKHEEYAKWEAARYTALKRRNCDCSMLTWRQRVKYSLVKYRWFGIAYFLASYFLKCGFLDGKAGLRFAKMKMWYFATIQKMIKETISEG